MYLGTDEPVEPTMVELAAALTRIEKTAVQDLKWRKIATGAAIAGALFAAIRLTDIWLAIKRRKREAL